MKLTNEEFILRNQIIVSALSGSAISIHAEWDNLSSMGANNAYDALTSRAVGIANEAIINIRRDSI